MEDEIFGVNPGRSNEIIEDSFVEMETITSILLEEAKSRREREINGSTDGER